MEWLSKPGSVCKLRFAVWAPVLESLDYLGWKGTLQLLSFQPLPQAETLPLGQVAPIPLQIGLPEMGHLQLLGQPVPGPHLRKEFLPNIPAEHTLWYFKSILPCPIPPSLVQSQSPILLESLKAPEGALGSPQSLLQSAQPQLSQPVRIFGIHMQILLVSLGFFSKLQIKLEIICVG